MATVLITGASSGIGEATAAEFAGHGWNVVATMRTPDRPDTDAVLVVPLDVTDPGSVDAAVRVGLERFGSLDVMVNNAGYGQYGLFEALSADDLRREFDVNVFGVMNVMRAVLPSMRAAGQGVVVNVSSGAGLYGIPGSSAYCASKFALEGFSEAVSYELSTVGITVKLVIPHGGVDNTGFHQRSAAVAVPPPAGYEAFGEQAAANAATAPPPRHTPARVVAQTIFAAATDGTGRLRYVVGDDVRGFVTARDTLPQDQYMAYMREHFRYGRDLQRAGRGQPRA